MNVAPTERKPKSPRLLRGVNDPATLERRRDLGQFFTPTEVAEFIWELLEIIHGRPFKPDTRVIDPACGEGVFLRVARARGGLSPKCLFGTDIDESLEKGWTQDPLLSDAKVFVTNGLLDSPRNHIVEGAFEIVAGNPPFSGKGMSALLGLLKEAGAGRLLEQDFFQSNSFKDQAIEATTAISEKQNTDLNLLVRALSQYMCWRLDAGSDADEKVNADAGQALPGLFAAAAYLDRDGTAVSGYDRAAHLIGHWPLNRPLDFSRLDLRGAVGRLAGTAIEVFFTERFVRLSKPGGLIAAIVPDSIVASDRMASFRVWMIGQMDLLACVSLPQKVFSGVGANARTSIIFGRRRSGQPSQRLQDEDRPIFLAAPRLEAADFSLETYLTKVLEDARRERNTFWPELE